MDRAQPLAAPERMDNGWLKVEGRIARCGIQEYEAADGGTRRELRPRDEVFKPESLASFRMVPVTNDHPPVLLDSTNTKTYQVGQLGENIRADGDYVATPMIITDHKAIVEVESGKGQLSNGYTCQLDEVPGTDPEFGPYDAIQRDIRGNHCALVMAGRAGPIAALRLDTAKNSVLPSEGAKKPPLEEPMPPQIRIDGRTFDLNEANAPAIALAVEEQKRRFDEALTGQKARADKAEKAHQTVKANAVELIGKVSHIAEVWDAMKARMMGCDECGGSGKVPVADGGDKSQKCDYCDGTGSVRMHDAVKGMGPPDSDGDHDGDADSDDDMDEALEAAETDANELEAEQATEEEAGKAAKKDRARRDAAEARRKVETKKLRAEERKDALKRRADSQARIIRRAMTKRIDLEMNARRYLDESEVSVADLAKKDEAEIVKLIVGKLDPEAKLDGLSADEVRGIYKLLIGRGPQFTVDEAKAMALRSLPGGEHPMGKGGKRDDSFFSADPEKARQDFLKRKADQNSGKKAAAGK